MSNEEQGATIASEVATMVGTIASVLDAGDEVTVTREDFKITATLSGDSVAPFIGRHGQVIDAVQHLATRVAAKHAPRGEWIVTVDAGDYRDRRGQILERIGNEAADRAIRSGRAVALDPMTASERRAVHQQLKLRTDVDTHSEGDEPDRHLVVTPKRAT